jgi:hypothetical protein
MNYFDNVATKLLLAEDAFVNQTLNVGSNGTNTAGISSVGTGDSAVRFWAGGSRSNAPFKVHQDGSIFASKGAFRGNITGATGTFSGAISVAGGDITITDAKVSIKNGKLEVKNPHGDVIIDGTSNMFKIVDTGLLAVRPGYNDSVLTDTILPAAPAFAFYADFGDNNVWGPWFTMLTSTKSQGFLAGTWRRPTDGRIEFWCGGGTENGETHYVRYFLYKEAGI